MDPKDVRPLLTAMSAESIVSLQEVAKSADRNPARTFFLWYVSISLLLTPHPSSYHPPSPSRYVDLQKAYAVILSSLYKTLYNISRRRQHEEHEPLLRAVLDKRQRTDVREDEERLLTRNEREMVRVWEKRREKLGVLEMRVEESVFLVRDWGIGVGDE